MPKIGRNEPCPCGSGRKYKRCCLGKGDTVSDDIPVEGWFAGDAAEDDALRTVFLGEGAEDLTDEVIAELAGRGWPEADLRRMKAEGAKYNRIRNSIVYPPETL